MGRDAISPPPPLRRPRRPCPPPSSSPRGPASALTPAPGCGASPPWPVGGPRPRCSMEAKEYNSIELIRTKWYKMDTKIERRNSSSFLCGRRFHNTYPWLVCCGQQKERCENPNKQNNVSNKHIHIGVFSQLQRIRNNKHKRRSVMKPSSGQEKNSSETEKHGQQLRGKIRRNPGYGRGPGRASRTDALPRLSSICIPGLGAGIGMEGG